VKFERITLYTMNMPLKAPFRTSFGVEEVRDMILVEVEADGVTGWGEVVTMHAPLYSYETTGTAWLILQQFLVPTALGREWDRPEELAAAWAHLRGHHMAKCGLENAFWDAWARAQGKPLAAVFGGVKERIPCGVSIGIQSNVPKLLETIEQFLAQGYQRIKIKIEPGWDLGVVREVRRRFPETPVMADANSAYSLDDIPLFAAMDEYGLMMFEQPLAEDDIVDHVLLQQRLRTPICLDESILHAEDARKAIELGACRIINLKVGRVGGHSEMLKIHRVCVERGVPLWCGGMLESGVGRAHNLALTALPGFTLPGDTSASDRYFHEDIVDEPARLEPGGWIRVPARPGIGVEVDRRLLEKYCVRTESFRAPG
jgi:o-succinylbenzoate synthase